MMQGAQPDAQPRECDGVGCGREVQVGEDVCIRMADSCMAETNTTL